MEKFKLSNGILIPAIGFGTWQIPQGEETKESVRNALEIGYRHIDTAAAYGNEKSVGEAVRESGINRQDIFITSKLWNKDRGYENTMKAFDTTLSKLGLDYLDLYLIHWPAQGEGGKVLNRETWRAFEKLYKEGKIKAIGVSNFLMHHLESLKETASVMPMVDQIEYHPGYTQPETVAYCKKSEIQIEAWSPLGSGKVLKDEKLGEIASRYNKSIAQLCVRYCIQNQILPLPKSVTPERIKQNLEVEDFTISPEDMDTINRMPYIGGSGLNPDKVKF